MLFVSCAIHLSLCININNMFVYCLFYYIPAVILCRCPFFLYERDDRVWSDDVSSIMPQQTAAAQTQLVFAVKTLKPIMTQAWGGGGRALEVERRFDWSPACQEVRSGQSEGAEIHYRLWPFDLRYLSTQCAPSSKIITFLNVFCLLLPQSRCFAGAKELVKMTEH